MAEHISTGYQIGTWAAGIIVALCLIGIVCSFLFSDDPVFFAISLVPVLLLTAGIWIATTWPSFDMQYHTYRKVGGTITAIESRGLADGHGTTFNYAVQFGTDQTYRCDDTRCAVLHNGDHLELWCVRDFQWNATPGWACNFADSRRAS